MTETPRPQTQQERDSNVRGAFEHIDEVQRQVLNGTYQENRQRQENDPATEHRGENRRNNPEVRHNPDMQDNRRGHNRAENRQRPQYDERMRNDLADLIKAKRTIEQESADRSNITDATRISQDEDFKFQTDYELTKRLAQNEGKNTINTFKEEQSKKKKGGGQEQIGNINRNLQVESKEITYAAALKYCQEHPEVGEVDWTSPEEVIRKAGFDNPDTFQQRDNEDFLKAKDFEILAKNEKGEGLGIAGASTVLKKLNNETKILEDLYSHQVNGTELTLHNKQREDWGLNRFLGEKYPSQQSTAEKLLANFKMRAKIYNYLIGTKVLEGLPSGFEKINHGPLETWDDNVKLESNKIDLFLRNQSFNSSLRDHIRKTREVEERASENQNERERRQIDKRYLDKLAASNPRGLEPIEANMEDFDAANPELQYEQAMTEPTAERPVMTSSDAKFCKNIFEQFGKEIADNDFKRLLNKVKILSIKEDHFQDAEMKKMAAYCLNQHIEHIEDKKNNIENLSVEELRREVGASEIEAIKEAKIWNRENETEILTNNLKKQYNTLIEKDRSLLEKVNYDGDPNIVWTNDEERQELNNYFIAKFGDRKFKDKIFKSADNKFDKLEQLRQELEESGIAPENLRQDMENYRELARRQKLEDKEKKFGFIMNGDKKTVLNEPAVLVPGFFGGLFKRIYDIAKDIGKFLSSAAHEIAEGKFPTKTIEAWMKQKLKVYDEALNPENNPDNKPKKEKDK